MCVSLNGQHFASFARAIEKGVISKEEGDKLQAESDAKAAEWRERQVAREAKYSQGYDYFEEDFMPKYNEAEVKELVEALNF